MVTAANVRGRGIGSLPPGGPRWRLGWVGEVIADAGFGERLVGRVARWCGRPVITAHSAPAGLRAHPRRWAVGRTLARLVEYRRLGRGHEFLPETGEAVIHAAMIHRMVRRLHPAA